jgi:hypothetical protein
MPTEESQGLRNASFYSVHVEPGVGKEGGREGGRMGGREGGREGGQGQLAEETMVQATGAGQKGVRG